jgi:phage terminase small subunit
MVSDGGERGDPPQLRVIEGGDGDGETPKAKAKAKRRKLTAKQERFLAEMIRGATQADAYRAAYDCAKSSPSAVYTEAGRLMAHPEITRRLHAHQASVERSAASSALSRRRFVLEGLEREATDAASDSARVAALVALGKTQGVDLFTDRVEQVGADQSPEEVRALLEERLSALLGKATG